VSTHSTGARLPEIAERQSCAKQADATLEALLTGLLTARENMRAELRHRPADRKRVTSARRQLLRSLEAYTDALTARGLSAPPPLRDELALQRGLLGAP
jgi:L-lactate utilization protein LutB